MINQTLPDIGVHGSIIHEAHKEFGFKHAIEFFPLKSKKELVQKIKDGHLAVVVSDHCFVVGKKRNHGWSNSNYFVAISDDKSRERTCSTSTSDLTSVVGVGKYYASETKEYEYISLDSRKYEKATSEEDEFVEQELDLIDQVYGEVIVKAAIDAISSVKQKLVDQIETCENWKISQFRSAIQQLAEFRAKGSAKKRGQNLYLQSINRLNHGWNSYYVNRSVMRENVKEPLFKQKYVKVILNRIEEIEQSVS